MVRTLKSLSLILFLIALVGCKPSQSVIRQEAQKAVVEAWIVGIQDLPNPTIVPPKRIEEFQERAVDELWPLASKAHFSKEKSSFSLQILKAHQAWREGLEKGEVPFDPLGVSFIKGFALNYGGVWRWVNTPGFEEKGVSSLTLETTTGYENLKTDDILPGVIITIMGWPPGRVFRVTTSGTPSTTRKYTKTIRARIWLTAEKEPHFIRWETLLDSARWVEDTRSF